MLKVVGLMLLKVKARKYIEEYGQAMSELGCGKTLGLHVSGRARQALFNLNKVYKKIKLIDPTAPDLPKQLEI